MPFQRVFSRESAQKARRLGRLGLCASCVFSWLTSYAEPKELVSLKAGALHSDIDFFDTAVSNHTDNAIVVYSSGREEWPNVSFNAVDKPWNLSGYFTVKADFTNLGSAPLYLGIRLDSKKASETETPQHAQGFELLDPAETRTISVRLCTEDWVFSKPLELVGMRRAPGVELMDVSHINRIQVFAGHVHEPCAFQVSNIRAEGSVRKVDPAGFLPFVDEFGQYRHHNWKGKVRSEADLSAARKAELKDLAAHPGMAGRNRFGGWADGPKREATGWFRVEKVDGKWWLVDPEGCLFWSTGPTCMNPDFGYTGVQERESYFDKLPKEDEPLGRFYQLSPWAPHGFYADKIPYRIYQFYKANLYRKYGEKWNESFIETGHRRLKSWGMNTVANWASPELYQKDRTPYVANFFIEGNRTLDGSRGYWGKFHDVFDPSFRATIRKMMGERKKEAADPWCIGFYVDNELSWGDDGLSLSLDTLACPADQPAKRVFIDDLKHKYKTIQKLNCAWGTEHASWPALLESQEIPDPVRAGEDLRAFYMKTADTYFRTVSEELKRAAPHHLYLGCRFAWVNDAAAVAAARYCDVVSYNKYNHSVRYLRLPLFIDKPLMVGEYHFGSTERGHFHPGLREARSQKERAEKYKAYVISALDNPHLVGVHWFQWVDEHIAGRADGENYNVGLVDICDTPYPEMVEASRELGKIMYTYRKGKEE